VRVAGVVLAAGQGRRLGGPKALRPWRGAPLLAWAVATLREGGCDPVAVAVAHRDAEAAARAAGGWPVAGGTTMLDSLRAALAALPTEVDGAVILPVDAPGVRPETVVALRAAAAEGAMAAVPVYAGRWGHPVWLARSPWGALVDPGPRGLESLLARLVPVEVPVDDPAVLRDVDTFADWLALDDAP